MSIRTKHMASEDRL